MAQDRTGRTRGTNLLSLRPESGQSSLFLVGTSDVGAVRRQRVSVSAPQRLWLSHDHASGHKRKFSV